MKTRFGGRQRPNLLLKRWTYLGGATEVPALPGPATPAAGGAAATIGEPVKPPSAREEMNDGLPF
jgi:hypothetical protein